MVSVPLNSSYRTDDWLWLQITLPAQDGSLSIYVFMFQWTGYGRWDPQNFGNRKQLEKKVEILRKKLKIQFHE